MRIQLSEHFDYKKLLRFVLPSVVMIVFTLIYGVVDGLFISNFVGKKRLDGDQSDHAASDHHGRDRIYDRYGRERARRQNAGRKGTRKSARIFFHARDLHGGGGFAFNGARPVVIAENSLSFGRRGSNLRLLRVIRQDRFEFHDLFHAAKRISKFFRRGGKTASGTDRNGGGRAR